MFLFLFLLHPRKPPPPNTFRNQTPPPPFPSPQPISPITKSNGCGKMLVFEAMIEINSSADLRPIQVLIFESRLHLRPISSFAFLAHITGCWAFLTQIELKLVVREKMGKKTSERERERE
jgi:hypothetical protein